MLQGVFHFTNIADFNFINMCKCLANAFVQQRIHLHLARIVTCRFFDFRFFRLIGFMEQRIGLSHHLGLEASKSGFMLPFIVHFCRRFCFGR